LVAYKDRGTPQPTKHTRAIHEKYCQLIDRHVGKSTESSTSKSPKVPEPKAYNGKEDAKVFEGWLKNLLRWYCINRFCSIEYDEDHILLQYIALAYTYLLLCGGWTASWHRTQPYL